MTLNDYLLLELTQKLKNPLEVKAFMEDPANANPDPLTPHAVEWADLSPASGYPGLLLLFSTLHRNGLLEKGDEIAHQYVIKIKEAIEKDFYPHYSLFGGVCGISFAIQQASMDGKRYQPMLNTLHQFLIKGVRKEFLEPFEALIRSGTPIPSSFYDCISGISGIGRYTLENTSNPELLELSCDITKMLIRLTQNINIDGKFVPGWYLPPQDLLNWQIVSTHTKGNFNLGVAHGIPGVLSLLSAASLKGINVEGQKEAIVSLSTWIRNRSFYDNSTIRWSHSISWEEEMQKKPNGKAKSQDGWCYGAPGVARTLFLAGKALKDDELKTFSAEAYRGIFKRKPDEWQLPGPALCHGVAGLLLITNEMAKEKECADLKHHVEDLRKNVLSFYDPKSPYGFQDSEPCKNGNRVWINKAGYLNGTTGILLSMLTLSDPNPNWHLPFMMHA